MDLFKPAWKTNNTVKAFDFIDKNKDNFELLMKIVLNAINDDIKEYAINSINGEYNLLILLKNNGLSDNNLKVKILKRINDKQILSKYLKSLKLNDLSKLISIIKDKDLSIKLLSCTFDYESFFMNLLNNLNDEELLKLIDNAMDLRVKEHAASKITDKDIMLKILSDEKYSYRVKDLVLANIEDENVYEQVLKDKKNVPNLRAVAIKKIKDKDLIKEIITDEREEEIVRLNGIMNYAFSDSKVFKELLKSESEKVKQAACERVGHDSEIIGYKPHGNGGKDAIYKCKICGKEELWPYEFSSADSV